MAIAIDGDGTITGISVGGLPDGIVDADMLGTKTFTSYAIICDQKANNTSGGGFTSGAWQTRDLNTEIADPDGIVSIASNQFTLQAGSYLIEARAPAYSVDAHQTRPYNATDASVVQYGTNAYAREATGDQGSTDSQVYARVTITASKAFEIQHRAQTTRATTGFGVGSDFSNEVIYTTVKIYKEA